MKKAETLSGLSALLLPWYAAHRRDLPWRHTRDPYAVMVSESMLQQTRVETVIPYYKKFMKAFPNVAALSAADGEKLLKLWQGLGYYRRARLLQKAAQTIQRQYGGVFPREVEALRELPGVGDYTAGAIASIAFGDRVPAVDGNVLRVVSRLTGDASDVSRIATRRRVAAMLKKIYPENHCGDFTQSLMELGATVCLPGASPHCGKCPLAGICTAKKEKKTAFFPVRAKPKARRAEKWSVFFLVCKNKIALTLRPGKGLLAGLYGFPMTPGFARRSFSEWRISGKYQETKHVFSHVEWQMRWHRAETETEDPAFTWATPEEISSRYPIPNAFKGYRLFL